MTVADALNPAFGVGDRIRKARTSVGLDQKDLADAVGVSRPLISRWERDLAVPDLNQAVTIAELTHTSLEWIAGLDLGLLPGNHKRGPVTARYTQPLVGAAA